MTEVPLVVDPATPPRVGGLPPIGADRFPRCFGRYEHEWQARRARNAQPAPWGRWYIEQDKEGAWCLMLNRS